MNTEQPLIRFGIIMESIDDKRVKITQTKLVGGYILNQKQLVERAKEYYPNKIIIPVVFRFDKNDVNLEYIKNRMLEFGIKRNDLIRQLAIDESSLSLLLSGKRGLSKSVKAAFFYYFLSFELNRDFRQYINNQ